MGAGTGGMRPQPGNSKVTGNTDAGRGSKNPLGVRGRRLLAPRAWASGLQPWERISAVARGH